MSANGIQKVTSGRPLRVLRNIAGSPYKKRRGSMNHTFEFDIGQSGVHYNCTVCGLSRSLSGPRCFSLQDLPPDFKHWSIFCHIGHFEPFALVYEHAMREAAGDKNL